MAGREGEGEGGVSKEKGSQVPQPSNSWEWLGNLPGRIGEEVRSRRGSGRKRKKGKVWEE